ncbi:ABC transporter permease [Jiulongibacter sediminis]|uniref:ABC transporter permease n=1 Tax=Jiulongibacter sediminis TaxID=1605367 RepID=UPI0026F23B88|nr:ABC transporter permease [Jiulongibacter sediminis]
MIRNYIKIAWRSLKRNKTYGAINVLGLVLSTASAILIFAFISFHLSFDDFHEEDDQIYRVVTQQKRESVSHSFSAPPALGLVLGQQFDFEEQITRQVNEQNAQISYGDNQKLVLEEGITYVNPSFFEIFNFPVLSGDVASTFEEPGKAAVTEEMANLLFGTSDVIGNTFKVDNSFLVTISAVLKDLPSNTFQESQVFLSYPTVKDYNEWYVDPDAWGGITSEVICFVKLKPGVDPADVEKAMLPFPEKYRPGSTNKHTYFLQPLAEMHFDPRYYGPMPERTLWTLGIIGLFLIISACLNFVNLATAQVFNRLKEVGVRKSLGSRRSQLFWQFLTETSLISFTAVILSFLAALLFLPYLNTLAEIELQTDALLNLNLLIFCVIVFGLVTLFSGSYPGLLLARFTPVKALKGKLAGLTVGGLNLRKGLIIVQFVISQVLIIGMLVILKQMRFNQTADLGFDREAVLIVPIGTNNGVADRSSFRQQLLNQADIENVSVCFSPPASGFGWGTGIRMAERDEPEAFHVSVKAGDENYLKTFGVTLLAGRNIRHSDTLNEIIVNETMLSKLNYTSPDEILGKYLSVSGNEAVPVVGVVKDFHNSSMYDEISPVVIGSFDNVFFNYAVKVNPQNIKAGLSQIEETWSELNPDEVFDYGFVDDAVREFYESEERLLSLLKVFTGIAIFIGAMGLFGLVSFMVERKTKEIGVRKVLGSSVAQILWIFGKEFTTLIVIAFVVASPLAWWFSDQWLQDFQFRVDLNVWIFTAALLLTGLVALVSVIFKVVKAATVNPVNSLRSE